MTFPSEQDKRQTYRVAMFGFPERTSLLLATVLKHARSNAYAYQVSESMRPGGFDLAMVDMGQARGRDAALMLHCLGLRTPIVRVGRRARSGRQTDDLLYGALTRQLVPTLNQAVEGKLLSSPQNLPSSLAQEAGTVASHRSQLEAPVVLLVDDSLSTLTRLAQVLERMGCKVETSSSGYDALCRLRDQPFDLVITDVQMAGLDGLGLATAIKRDASLAKIPVAILTARSSPLDRARGVLAGADAYLTKPVPLRALQDTVIELLRRTLPAERVSRTVHRLLTTKPAVAAAAP